MCRRIVRAAVRPGTMAGMRGGVPHRADRILGCGVLLSGCVLLGIGLILGLEFPRYVIYQKRRASCVTSDDTQHYRDWLSGYNSTSVSLLTIWSVTSAETLDQSTTTNRTMFGPYVFTGDERKVGLDSRDGLLLFRVLSRYRYDEDLTRRHCAACHDHDEVAVMSTVRQQMLSPFAGSEATYLRRHVAAMARVLRHSWPARLDSSSRGFVSPTGPLASVSQLTCRRAALDTALLRLAAPGLLLPALRLLQEPGGVVRAPLREEACAAVWRRLLSGAVVSGDRCEVYRTVEALHCDVRFFVERHERLSESERTRMINATVQLISCHANYSLNQLSGSASTPDLLSLLSRLALRLQQAVSDVSILNLQTDILRGPVSQMALGFRVRTVLFTSNSVSCWDLPQHTVLEDSWISGALRHHESEQHSLQHASLRSLATCLYNRSKESNLLWHDRVTVAGRRLEHQAAGFSGSLPPASHVTACGRRVAAAAVADIYEPRVWLHLRYVRSGRSPALGQVALTEFIAPGENASLHDLRAVSEFDQWIQLAPIGQLQQSQADYSPKSVVLLEVGCVGLVTCSLMGGLAVLAGYLVFLGFISCRGGAVAPLLPAHH